MLDRRARVMSHSAFVEVSIYTAGRHVVQIEVDQVVDGVQQVTLPSS